MWTHKDMARSIVSHFDPMAAAGKGLRVLEAGGGSSSHIALPSDARITTIDISQEQLDRNDYADEKICGDIQTFDFGVRRYDLIVVWEVLEHVAHPEQAVAEFCRVLAPGGRIIVVGPITRTIKGMVTKFSPHAFHVFYYKRFLGSTTAGQPGHAPFPTYHATCADPGKLRTLVGERGLQVEALIKYETVLVQGLRDRSSLLFWGYRAAEHLAHALTLGKWEHGKSDFYLIASKAA